VTPQATTALALLMKPIRIFGRSYWVYIWYGILALGVLGFIPALQWGRETHWKNLDEILRGFGTICVSLGMIFLLGTSHAVAGYFLLLLAVAAFIGAFAFGRKGEEK
jgi:hypothetical protein